MPHVSLIHRILATAWEIILMLRRVNSGQAKKSNSTSASLEFQTSVQVPWKLTLSTIMGPFGLHRTITQPETFITKKKKKKLNQKHIYELHFSPDLNFAGIQILSLA